MNEIAILSFTSPTKSHYYRNIAKEAVKLGVNVYHFSPIHITPTKTVLGYQYNNKRGKWLKTTFQIPPFIYDQCYYINKRTMAYKEKVNWLKKQANVHFLANGLPNKWLVFQPLLKQKSLQPFFPITIKATHDLISSSLKEYKTILLKPIHGLQGNGIIKLRTDGTSVYVTEVVRSNEEACSFHSIQDCLNWLDKKDKEYIIQPFLPLQDELNHPFDVRILMQKNSNGKWEEKIRVIRKGKQHSITSNLGTGGSIVDYSLFEESPELRYSLQTITQHLPITLEKHFSPLFELGIDIGITPDFQAYILDINSKPGHKVLEILDDAQKEIVYQAPIRYAMFLEQTKERRKTNEVFINRQAF